MKVRDAIDKFDEIYKKLDENYIDRLKNLGIDPYIDLEKIDDFYWIGAVQDQFLGLVNHGLILAQEKAIKEVFP